MSDPFHPYAAQHANLNGAGDARPTAMQILRDDDLIGKWAGRVCLVTGATSGIGIETARALHATGADVYITARDSGKARPIVEDIKKTTSEILVAGAGGKLEVIIMDMDSLASVKKAAAEFLGKCSKLNVDHGQTKGIMACPYTLTADGFERQFGVNHLAHFTLTVLLLPALRAAATPASASRVVQVTSSLHRLSTVNFDDVSYTTSGDPYDPFKAYGQSKTAMQWTANYIDRVYGADPQHPVHAYSLHPGGIWSGLQAYVDPELFAGWKADPVIVASRKSPGQAAATTIWAAAAKVWEGKGGKYLNDCAVAPPLEKDFKPTDSGYAAWVYQPESEDKVWKMSLKMVGLEEPKL